MNGATDSTGDSPERALVLRLWREGEGNGAVWRCSVEDPRTKQRRGFPSLAELLSFLDLLTHRAESASLFDAPGSLAAETRGRAPKP